jgi:hypothetical protein
LHTAFLLGGIRVETHVTTLDGFVVAFILFGALAAVIRTMKTRRNPAANGSSILGDDTPARVVRTDIPVVAALRVALGAAEPLGSGFVDARLAAFLLGRTGIIEGLFHARVLARGETETLWFGARVAVDVLGAVGVGGASKRRRIANSDVVQRFGGPLGR